MSSPPNFPAVSSATNVMALTGASAEIHSDFNQNGNVEKNRNERAKRYMRPGAIVLPNLNLSAGLPAGSPNVDLSKHRDADNDIIENAADLAELTEVIVQSPSVGALDADELVYHVDPKDADRFNLFEKSGGAPNTWPIFLGK